MNFVVQWLKTQTSYVNEKELKLETKATKMNELFFAIILKRKLTKTSNKFIFAFNILNE